jgi:hypothetical protein
MLSLGDGFDHRSAAMEVRQYIRPDVTLSAIVHLSLVACVVIYTEVRPFRSVAEKTVPVDVIVADEKKPEPLPTPEPSPDLSMLAKPVSPPASTPAAPPAASPPPQQASRANRHEAPAQPQAQAPASSAAPAPPASPGYTAPEPDLTIKYHVMLGLPQDIPADVSAGDKRGEGGDASPASDNLASSLVDALRRHLKTCSKLPAALSPSDNIAVKLRVQMTADGRLAAEPALIEGTASMKGVQLMQGAIAALTACQPYAMLPADRYGEWKVLDLSFTPRDFSS